MIQNSTTTPPNEDSYHNPVIQIMSQINQQQMRVRNPSQESRKVQNDLHQIKITNQKSPIFTQISVQLASDRMSPHNQKDLLLINEEPSHKEDSQQLSMIRKQNDYEKLYRKSDLNKSSAHNSSLRLFYYSKQDIFIKQILSKQQIKIIHDLSSVYIIPLKQQIIKLIQQDSIIKKIIYSLYICFLVFYLTILLIELGCNDMTLSNQYIFHYLLVIFQLIDCVYQIIINKLRMLTIFADVSTMLPFFAFLLDLGDGQKIFYMLYLIRIYKITDFIQNLNFYSNQQDQLFVIMISIQIHFATFIAQTIIYMFAEQQQDYINYIQNIFVLLFFNPNIKKRYQFIIYLIRILLLIFYSIKIRQAINYQSIALDHLINYSPKTLKSIINYQEENKAIKFDMKSLPIHVQQKMKREKYLKILQNIPIFQKSFSNQTLLNLCDIIVEDTLKPNKVVKQKQCLHFLLEGQIEIVQKCQSSSKEFKLAKIESQFQIFNNIAFFQNQLQGIEFKSIGYSKIATLDYIQFHNLIRLCPQEFQKYRMLIDTLLIENQSYLINIQCFSCFKEHDITECPVVNYKPNKNQVLQNFIIDREQKRVNDFKRKVLKKNRKLIAVVKDSEVSNSEQYDKVEQFQKVLVSSNSMQSQNNNNFINQLEISSVPYINYSHSGQTLQSKKIDSEQFLSPQGVSSSISSKKVFINEIKEVGQLKFQRHEQQSEDQQVSSLNYHGLQRVQDSVLQTKKRFNQNTIKKDDIQQLQRYQTDIQSELKKRDLRKNQTMVNNSKYDYKDNYNRRISIENNFLELFEKINSFDDYFPHYNVDQQIKNYEKMQFIQKDNIK